MSDVLAVLDEQLKALKEEWKSAAGRHQEAIAESHGNLMEAREAFAELLAADVALNELLDMPAQSEPIQNFNLRVGRARARQRKAIANVSS